MGVDLLLDMSVLIDLERGIGIDLASEARWGIAAMTLAELNVGLLRAVTPPARQRRMRSYLEAVNSLVLPFDEVVARTYAELVAWAETEGRRPSVADAIIAATAATHGATLVTLDNGFEHLAGFEGLEVCIV